MVSALGNHGSNIIVPRRAKMAGTSGNERGWHFGLTEERTMPVLLLWAVPAIVVVGGVGYYVLHAVH